MAHAFPAETPRSRSMEHKRPMISSSQITYSFALLLAFSLLCFISHSLLLEQCRSPHHLPIHQPLPDGILFQKAVQSSFSSPGEDLMPKVAFMFLTNSDITFSPLWDRFLQSSNPNLFNVYVHADPTTPVEFPTSNLFNTRFIPGNKTCRGSPSLISAERRLIARAILDDPLNKYFALISQHCIPLHSFNFLYNFLFPHKPTTWPKSFIEIISEDPNLPERYNARGENSMLPEVPFKKFRVGSQFFLLEKRHALMVLSDTKLWRKFNLPCVNLESCYPEEHYFPTLLSMEDPSGCSGYTLTNVNWTGSVDGHPHLYRPEEISGELIHRLRRSNSTYSFLFARKFAPGCLQPLMEIADDVIFRD